MTDSNLQGDARVVLGQPTPEDEKDFREQAWERYARIEGALPDVGDHSFVREAFYAAWDEARAHAWDAALAASDVDPREMEWAHKLLDMAGAPRTIYNPFDRCEDELNLPGRISRALDPKNEGIIGRASDAEISARAAKLDAFLKDLAEVDTDGTSYMTATLIGFVRDARALLTEEKQG